MRHRQRSPSAGEPGCLESPGLGRTASQALLLGFLVLLNTLLPPGDAWAQTRASVQQVKEAWLASDAVVYGVYQGIDTASGPAYHRIDVAESWIGSASPGPLLFKAPRGVKADSGDTVLLMFWDELNGATHAFLQKAQRIYGEDLWASIGPDSVTPYLLPFSRFAFQFEKGKIDLRGTGIFNKPVKKKHLRRDLIQYELQLIPEAQFQISDVVVEAIVTEREFRMFEFEGVAVELRVHVEFRAGDIHKGEVPPTFDFEYGSFPRSPRFEAGDSVLLFLQRRDDSWFLPNGKRGIYHIEGGEVLETGQPLHEFLEAMRQP